MEKEKQGPLFVSCGSKMPYTIIIHDCVHRERARPGSESLVHSTYIQGIYIGGENGYMQSDRL